MWNIGCVHWYTIHVHGFRTHVHIRNFNINEIADYTTCIRTYVYKHEKTCMQIFNFFGRGISLLETWISSQKLRKFISKIFSPKVFYEIVKWVLDKFYLTCVSSLMKSVFSMGFRLWLVESLVIVKPHASLKVWPTIMH